ncbi:hypothetical protein TCDM_00233 [Trypanosoma cruzi Dm28c]|uniref:Uncharacterized protein n=2 Tax=Trypanosoma cruzi TaxID=5693 RepID=V5BTJ6_TRYCR|nr:hypothetical protein TCDM_00233 [Trypanosoma cruzi Dm28c]PWV02393.1 hypothetical protein C4B63_2g825 [Trypanosoma cruzi]
MMQPDMSLLPLYRSLLRRIHAAQRLPHHLQDIRFILSYPLVEAASRKVTSSGEVCGSGLLRQHRVDPSHVVRACCDDLHRALLSFSHVCDTPSTSHPLPPVAQRLIHMRELVWLKARLEKVLSESTQTILKEAEMVASELNETDFLDDAFFVEKDLTKDGEAEKEWRSHNNTEEDMCATGVASAGELGLRREMFVLRHIAPFPLAAYYLSSFNMDSRAIAAAAGNSEWLLDFVQQHVPRRVVCQNADLTLTVSVRLFDEAMEGKRVEKGSPFSQAHRSFMLRFELQPRDPTTRIDVVNSYFLRLDVASSELIEDVGYVHAAHVWKLAQYPYRGNGTHCDSVDNNDDDGRSDGVASGDHHRHCHEGVDDDVASQFELSFINPSDNPMVMKGQLYYILRAENDNSPACELPVRVISFGQLLLFNRNE